MYSKIWENGIQKSIFTVWVGCQTIRQVTNTIYAVVAACLVMHDSRECMLPNWNFIVTWVVNCNSRIKLCLISPRVTESSPSVWMEIFQIWLHDFTKKSRNWGRVQPSSIQWFLLWKVCMLYWVLYGDLNKHLSNIFISLSLAHGKIFPSNSMQC